MSIAPNTAFLKQAKAILKQHQFSRVNNNNYKHHGIHFDCIFNFQKSRYSSQYYFNIIYKLSHSSLDSEIRIDNRLEEIMPKYFEIIRSINFDESYSNDYCQLFLDKLPEILTQLQSITHIDNFIAQFSDYLYADTIQSIKNSLL